MNDNIRSSISPSGEATTSTLIKTYEVTFMIHADSSSCSGQSDREIAFLPDQDEVARNRQYGCSISEENTKLGIKSAVPKITCGRSPELFECSFLSDLRVGVTDVSVWDKAFLQEHD
jgi:hypothetical protein